MSTSKPRITITLEPHVYEVISRLSAASGDSMSSLVTGFLHVAVPPMERLVVVLEAANAAPKEARDGLAASLARAESRVIPQLVEAMGQTDLFLREISLGLREATVAGSEQAAEPRSRKRRPDTLSTPVPVTRGLGPTGAAQKRLPKRVRKGAKSGSL
jgi:hypothetical protein